MIVWEQFSVTVIILTIAEMLALFQVLGSYRWVHVGLWDGEYVRSQLDHSHIEEKIHKLIRGIQNSAGVGLGLHLPWYAVVGFVWFVYTVLSSSRVCEKLSLSHSTVGCWEIMLYAGRSPVCHSVMSFFIISAHILTWQCLLFDFLKADSKRFVNSFFRGRGNMCVSQQLIWVTSILIGVPLLWNHDI